LIGAVIMELNSQKRVMGNKGKRNKTDKVLCVSRNVEGRYYNHRCVGKAISITYCGYVFVALVGMRIRHMVICGLSGRPVFSHIIS
jgi:hypothetical protein